MDLEKRILEAVDRPSHDKDPDGLEPHRGAEDSDAEDAPAAEMNDLAISTDYKPQARPERHQTGPKGVLTDYKHSRNTVEDILKQDELDQDEAVVEWREKRLKELQGGVHKFGKFREIGLNNFEKTVLEEGPGVKVVLHLFEAHLPACLVLNLHLSNLAREYPSVKFLRAQASELEFAQNSSDVVLPTLLVYEQGELVANLIAVDLAWNRTLDYDEEQVRKVLIEHDVLPPAIVNMHANGQRQRRLSSSSASSD